MKKYGDLNLKKVCEVAGLDFAHFTYQKNQCSCCYKPTDMSKNYWYNKEKFELAKEGEEVYYTFILFSNAHNGSGTVTKNDEIKSETYINYRVDNEEQMKIIVQELQNQLEEYQVIMPNNVYQAIKIIKLDQN